MNKQHGLAMFFVGVSVLLFYMIFVDQPSTLRSVFIAIDAFCMGAVIGQMWRDRNYTHV